MMKTATDVLTEWMLAVNQGDLERLLALYHENAVLIPMAFSAGGGVA